MKNNHILTAVALATFVSPHLLGQPVTVGAKAGISIPNIRGNTEQSKGYSSRQGIYFGLLFNRKINDRFSLQTEVNYSPQGGQRNRMQPVPASQFSGVTLPEGTTLYADFRNKTILNYIEVPLLGQLTCHKTGRIPYYCNIQFGPYIAYLIKAQTVTSGTSNIYLDAEGRFPLTLQDGTPLPAISFDNKTNINEEIKKINAGLAGGIDIGYSFGYRKIFVEGRFILGLTNIQTHPEESGKNHTGSVNIALGYACKINGKTY